MKTTKHAERLRKWAENVAEYGPDIRQWGSSLFVIEEMRKIADDFATMEATLEKYAKKKNWDLTPRLTHQHQDVWQKDEDGYAPARRALGLEE